MKVFVKNKDGEIEIHEEYSYISRNACINYIEQVEDEDFMAQMVWWGNFGHLIDEHIEYEELKKWCEENCEGLIYINSLSYRVQFEIEEDVVAFRLRWS